MEHSRQNGSPKCDLLRATQLVLLRIQRKKRVPQAGLRQTLKLLALHQIRQYHSFCVFLLF